MAGNQGGHFDNISAYINTNRYPITFPNEIVGLSLTASRVSETPQSTVQVVTKYAGKTQLAWGCYYNGSICTTADTVGLEWVAFGR